MKANKTRNELKVSDSKTYRLKNEERMKNGEERRKTFTDSLTKTSQKRYRSTLAWIFFTEIIFSPKTVEMHSPPPLFIGKKEVLAAQRLLEEDF